MHTYALQYSYADALSRAFVKSVGEPAGISSYYAPSPFDLPQSVEIEVQKPHLFTFHFEYADREEPESTEYAAGQEGSAFLKVGAKTKKVLSVRFDRDIDQLVTAGFAIDPALVIEATSWSRRAINSFVNSALLVQEIMSSVPADLVDKLRVVTRARASAGRQG